MDVQSSLELTDQNADSYDDLLVSIEASEGMLSLLIAVCDDGNFREQIIQKYETELQPEIRSYRVTLARGEPSLRAAIAQLVQSEQYLSQGGRAVLTVTGIEQFYFLKLGEERSEQELFFGYLQWTREGMREFPFPIVIWLTPQIQVSLSKEALDFWSWRKGVFRFVSRITNTVSKGEITNFNLTPEEQKFIGIDDEASLIPLEDLQELIRKIEQQRGNKDPSLAALYFRMGNIYKGRLDKGESQDYQQEQALAIEYFDKAIELQKEFGLEEDLATSLNNLAGLYKSQGRYTEAEPLYLQALELRQRLLGDNHPLVAQSFNNLAALYKSQGRYTEAEPLHLQALELTQRLLGDNHPLVATSLNNLAYLYKSQGRYSEAEPLYLQALELSQRNLGDNHPDVAQSLNNLAGLYKSQGRYSEAEPLYLQSLELRQRHLGENHPDVAASLNNLAYLYSSQGRYSEAEPLYLQALELRQRLLGDNHPLVATSLNNLAYLYKSQGRYSEAEPLYLQALELYKRLLGENHPYVATSLNNLAALYKSQGRYSEAEPLYLQSLELRQSLLGENHPHTVTIRKNLETLRAAMP
ncbi:MAG: tetratricopeptide repeat protein [Coleofasciculaceae cyanobacterium]